MFYLKQVFKLQVKTFTMPVLQTRVKTVAHAYNPAADTRADVCRIAMAGIVRMKVSKVFTF